MLYTKCNKTNHMIDNCYFKHGFPSGYRNRNTKPSSDSKVTTNMDKQNIISKKYYQHFLQLLQQSKKYDQTLNLDKPSPVDTPYLISNIFNIGNDLNQFSMQILDSGASDNVCPHIKCFYDIRMIQSIHINFPNGNTLIANFSGTIFLNNNLHMHNAIFRPEFQFSLISISRPCRNFLYKLYFSHNSCHI